KVHHIEIMSLVGECAGYPVPGLVEWPRADELDIIGIWCAQPHHGSECGALRFAERCDSLTSVQHDHEWRDAPPSISHPMSQPDEGLVRCPSAPCRREPFPVCPECRELLRGLDDLIFQLAPC